MTIRTTLLAAALALTPLLAHAGYKIPADFIGKWCEVNHDTSSQYYVRRDRCAKDQRMVVRPDGLDECMLAAIARSEKGNYLVVMYCPSGDDNHSFNDDSHSYWLSLENGKLVTTRIRFSLAGPVPGDM